MLWPIITHPWKFMREISTSGDLKSGDSLFCSNSPTHPPTFLQSTQSPNYIMGIDQAIKRVSIEVHRVLIQLSKFSTNQMHYPDLGSDASSVWNSALVSLASFRGKTCGGIANALLFSQATVSQFMTSSTFAPD